MNRENFEYYWKIAVLILLVIGIVWTVAEFRQISKDGIACKSQPFIYGARVMAGKQSGGHMDCSCQIYGDDYSKSYSFNEVQENPLIRSEENYSNLFLP